MSGAKPADGTPAAGASDQSMEDILASIRRILNEDETPAAMPEEPAPSGAEPLLLTEAMMVNPPADPPPPPMPPPPAMPAEAVAPPVSEPAPAPLSMALPDDGLLAPAVAAAATASVGQLLRAVSSERGSMVHRGGPSIEDVVREELRPLLKDWLDQHLPVMVERLVRSEIERVVGRALS